MTHADRIGQEKYALPVNQNEFHEEREKERKHQTEQSDEKNIYWDKYRRS